MMISSQNLCFSNVLSHTRSTELVPGQPPKPQRNPVSKKQMKEKEEKEKEEEEEEEEEKEEEEEEVK
ncbi:hypothetical protein ACQP3D_30385, partial [Escherichia coli]